MLGLPLLLLALPAVLGYQINIGGLFHNMEIAQELAFKYAAESINLDRSILTNNTLVTHIETVPPLDSFQVSLTVCKLLGVGMSAIFGPNSADPSDHVQSMCDTMDVPHIETRWDTRQRRQDFLVNLFPHPSTMSRVYVDLVNAWGWKSLTVIYEDSAGLVRLSELFKLSRKDYRVTVRQLVSNVASQRAVLRMIRDSGDKNIVLDCSIDRLPEILKQAQQVGLMVQDMNFIITNLDMHTINMEPYQWSGTNITGIRLVDPQSIDVQLAVKGWSDNEMRRGIVLDITADTLRVSTALLHDAVYLFAKALSRLEGRSLDVTPLDCNAEATWHHGSSLINFMKDGQITHRGLTGLIQFDNEGFRSKFQLDVIQLSSKGLQKIGTWNSSETERDRLNVTGVHSDKDYDENKSMFNMTLIVLTALSKPYGMLKDSTETLYGNNRFEGFGIDLIQEISIICGFNYTFELQDDKNYGSKDNVTKEWNGMMRKIIDNEAQLAITDLTITRDREEAVDFTNPFMNLGISILYMKPKKAKPKLFSFLSTFSNGVWIYMLLAYTGVSLVMFITGRISPKEWTNPYPCIKDPDELENQFNMKNAFWFTIGSLMQQGSEIAPIAISTRMVAGIWWFFTLIMVSSYTANLAAVLTVEAPDVHFKNIEELANHKTIKYGAKAKGSTANFFRDSSDEVYQRMWHFMSTHPEVWTTSNEEGEEWVLKGGYAYFMESTSIEFISERNCNLTQVGGMLDAKGYGIAMRKNSTWRNALSSAVLQLQESGKLSKLKNKWWKEERGGGACSSPPPPGASQLSLAHVGGVFVVLVSGVSLAIVFTVIELVYDVCNTAYREKVPFRTLIIEELKFVARCRGSTKPVRKYNNTSGSDEGEDAQHSDARDDFDSGFRAEALREKLK